MSNFSDFINNYESKKTEKTNTNKSNPSKEELQKMIDEYSSFSEDKLLKEFIKLTIEKKSKGELTEKDIIQMKSTIEPFLNSEQKQKLNDLIQMVKNV